MSLIDIEMVEHFSDIIGYLFKSKRFVMNGAFAVSGEMREYELL